MPTKTRKAPSVCIGVLDLQGDVREHLAALRDVGSEARPVKRPADLDGLDGLILPGGESTTLSMLLESTGLFDAIVERLTGCGSTLPGSTGHASTGRASTGRASTGRASTRPATSPPLPLLGTCAGLVLVAREVLDGRPDQRTFGVLNALVRRNGYGRQVRSFEGNVIFGSGEDRPLPAVFIRAPFIESVGEGVEVLGTFNDVPVLVRQGSVLASVFHPELTSDRRVHRLFEQMCRQIRSTRSGSAPLFGA